MSERVQLLWYAPEDPEGWIYAIGRVSHSGEDIWWHRSWAGRSRVHVRDWIRRRVREGHESVLEFGYAVFYIPRISRVALAQITRHRLASFCVRSQRYTEVSRRDFEYLEEKFEGYDGVGDLLREAWNVYVDLVERCGVRSEEARMVLPQGITTQMVIGANFREWRHILRLRTHESAQEEIRELMREVGEELMKIAPSVFEDVVVEG